MSSSILGKEEDKRMADESVVHAPICCTDPGAGLEAKGVQDEVSFGGVL